MRNERRTETGFTLIEVLVALAIAALGLVFLLAATGSGIENGDLAAKYIQATRRAQSRLAQIGVTQPLAPGEYSGDDGGGFRWRMQIAQPLLHARTADAAQASVGLYAVDVSVSWRSGDLQKVVSLHSERLGPP